MLSQSFLIALAVIPVTLASPYYNPYFGKYFHGQRTSGDSSSSGNFYPVKDCSAFIDQNPETSWSCHNKSPVSAANSCCFEENGIILLTQFWDYNTTLLEIAVNGSTSDIVEAELKSKLDTVYNDLSRTFTIHGTWDDFCNGSYPQYCNKSLEVSDEKIILPIFWLINLKKLNYIISCPNIGLTPLLVMWTAAPLQPYGNMNIINMVLV